MELRRLKLLQELREAREDLLNINFATDTTNRIGVSRPYALVDEWLNKRTRTFQKHYAFIQGRMNIPYRIREELNGQNDEEDPEVFNELRPIFVEYIDQGLSMLDQEYLVKPVLEDYIKRVKDTKLVLCYGSID